MKIFLNDRIIQFTGLKPAKIKKTDLFINYETPSQLTQTFTVFESNPDNKNLFIQYQDDNGLSEAYNAFLSMFKVVEAAGGVVKNEKGDTLFIHRLGYWDLPKGKISKKDRGEVLVHPSIYSRQLSPARVAAIREVKEETGLHSVIVKKELLSTWHIYYVKQNRILKHTRWFEMIADSSQPLIPQTEEDILLVRWIPPQELDTIREEAYPSLRELF